MLGLLNACYWSNLVRELTSAERQHNRIAEWFLQCKLAMQIWSESTINPDSLDYRKSILGLITWSLGHAIPLQEISSKSVKFTTFFSYPVIQLFQLHCISIHSCVSICQYQKTVRLLKVKLDQLTDSITVIKNTVVCPSVRHTGGSVENGWSYDHAIFTMQ